jgi:hypothetical protein
VQMHHGSRQQESKQAKTTQSIAEGTAFVTSASGVRRNSRCTLSGCQNQALLNFSIVVAFVVAGERLNLIRCQGPFL